MTKTLIDLAGAPATVRTARPRAQLVAGRSDWYSVTAQAIAGDVEVVIFDEIGYWGVTAQDFAAELAAIPGVQHITLRLNSPGGSVFDGIAIYNTLVSHPATVDVVVDGLAASIASVIAMAGDTITMAATATMMIHDGLCLCVGNAAELRAQADLLDKVSDNIASVYAARAGGDVATWRAAMLAETWYSAVEATAAGLCDAVTPRKGEEADPDPDAEPADRWDLSIFARYRPATPAALEPAAPTDPPEPSTAEAFEFDADLFREAMEGAFK